MDKFFIEKDTTYKILNTSKLNMRSPFKFKKNDYIHVTEINSNHFICWIAREGEVLRSTIVQLKISKTDHLKMMEDINFYEVFR